MIELDELFRQMRHDRFKASGQLSLGELIHRLKNIDPALPLYFDFGNFAPIKVSSWRGAYRELAIEYVPTDFFDEALYTGRFLKEHLEPAVGKVFIGYKGGEYTMTKSTPVWVANWGASDNTGVVGVITSTHETFAVIQTAFMEF